jgi:hypothetical protein
VLTSDIDQTDAKGAGAGTFLLNPRSDVRYQGLMSDPSEGLFPFGQEAFMNGLIYLIGVIVVIMFILSFLGLR